MDMEFTQQTNPKEDDELVEAVGRAHGKVVLGTVNVFSHPRGGTQILGGNQVLHELGARPASARLELDTDGVIRRFPYSYNGLKSFPVVTVETASGHGVPASRFGGGTLPIDFPGPPGTVRSISYSKVLAGEFNPSMFAHKIVIVGASAPILQDVHATATTSASTMPGSEVWADATSTLLAGVPLKDVPGWLNLLVIVLMGVLAPFGSLRLRPLRALLDALAAAIVFTIATQVAFDKGWIISSSIPCWRWLATLGTLAVLYCSARRRARARA